MTTHKSMTLAELWQYLEPHWEWVAMDKSGRVYVFTDKPGAGNEIWMPTAGDGCSIPFTISDMNPDWTKSLVERPVDYSQYVGCLGWFWDSNEHNPLLGELLSVDDEGAGNMFRTQRGCWLYHFRPCTSAEIAVWAAKAKEAGV